MSKLFQTITKLEDIEADTNNDSSAAEVPYPTEVSTKENNSKPWLRIVLLSTVLILIGGAIIGFTAWYQDWFVIKKEVRKEEEKRAIITDLPTANIEKKTQAPLAPIQPSPRTTPSDLPIPAVGLHPADGPPAAKQILMDTVNISFAVSQYGQIEKPQGATPLEKDTKQSNSALLSTKGIAEKETEDFSSQIQIRPLLVANNFIQPELPQPLDINNIPPVDRQTSLATRNIIDKTTKMNRWLHQAERHRRNGEWEGAVVLYAKIWEVSKRPEIANNLAASLIQLDRPKEALTILESGLERSPIDKDLQDNLELVKQILGSQSAR